MNIVLAKHGINHNRSFCFSVTDDQAQFITKGTILWVDTIHGPSKAIAVSEVASGKGAEEMAYKLGAYAPIKRVISFIPRELEREIKNMAFEFIKGKINALQFTFTPDDPEELPF